MSGLYKKEVIIRPTSSTTIEDAENWTKNWLNNTFQEKDTNKDADGNYIDYFFGDIFDARTGNIYRVFSDACADKYSMTTLVFEVLKTSKFAKETDLSGVNSAIDAVNNKADDNSNRIEVLENSSDEVEAVVI